MKMSICHIQRLRLGGTMGVPLYWLGPCAYIITSKEPGEDSSDPDAEPPIEVEIEAPWRYNRCLCVLLVVWLRGFAHI